MEIKDVLVSRFAKEDLREIVSFYQSLSQSYVEKTISEFEENILSLKDFPRSGRIVPELQRQGIENFRELIQGHYRIIYELAESSVHILAVIDGRRDVEEIIVSKLLRTYKERQ